MQVGFQNRIKTKRKFKKKYTQDAYGDFEDSLKDWMQLRIEYYRNKVPEFPKGNVNLVRLGIRINNFEYSTNFWKDLLIKIHLEALEI